MIELSIIVAIYNVEDYIDKCLDSLCNQSVDNGYQVVCVNDGSTDKSRDIILKYVNADKRFILLDKKNGGLSDARNHGLKHIDSKYVSFVDGDDYVSSDYVETTMKYMKKDNLDMLVFAYNQYYLSNNTYEKTNLLIKDGIYDLRNNKELLAYTPNATWNKVYKTSLFKNNSIEFPYGYRYQDLGTTPKLLLKCKKIGYLNKELYNYLLERPNSITTQIDRKLYDIIDMSKEAIDYYINEKQYMNYCEEFEYLIKRNFIQTLRKAMLLKDTKFVNKFIDDIFQVYDEYFANNKHTYNLIEENGDDIYVSKIKSKIYYLVRKLKR